MKFTRRFSAGTVALLAGAVVLAGCSSGGPADDASEAAGETTASAAGSDGPDHAVEYPLTIENCDAEMVFDEAPERVMLLETAPVTILDGIGVFDRIFTKAGIFPLEYYDDELAAKVDAIPLLTEKLNSSGHLQISQEEIVAQEPDVILGKPDGVSREQMEDAGIHQIIQEIYCPGASDEATFQSLYDEISRYGQIFDRVEEADALNAELQDRVASVSEAMSDHDAETAVALYPSVGGGTLYAYGHTSMVQPQFEALGLENLFEDNHERVFEIQAEVLVDMDPDVILILYSGSKEAIENEVESLPGADQISALVHDRVVYQLFNFTEPATPLTVTGLERLAQELYDSSN